MPHPDAWPAQPPPGDFTRDRTYVDVPGQVAAAAPQRVKIRADALKLAQLLVDAGTDLSRIPPASDGWHSRESLSDFTVAALAADRDQRGRAGTRKPWGDGDAVDWAYTSGRITAASVATWRGSHARDPVTTERVLEDLAPVLATTPGSPWVRDANGNMVLASAEPYALPSSTPLLDQLDEAVFGPSAEVRHAREDAAAERELREAIEAEALKAANAPADSDFDPLFPPEAGSR